MKKKITVNIPEGYDGYIIDGIKKKSNLYIDVVNNTSIEDMEDVDACLRFTHNTQEFLMNYKMGTGVYKIKGDIEFTEQCILGLLRKKETKIFVLFEEIQSNIEKLSLTV